VDAEPRQDSRRTKASSLRLRFALVILACLALGIPVSAVLDYRAAVQLANEGYDHAIQGSAEIIVAAIAPMVRDPAELARLAEDIGARVAVADDDDEVGFAVLRGDQAVAGDPAIARLAEGTSGGHARFIDARLAEVPVRVVVAPVPGDDGLRVVVAESTHRRNQIASDILSNVVYVNLLTFLLMAVVLVLATGWAIRPLLRLGQAVDTRRPDDLRPLGTVGLPSEAYSLVGAINRLLGSLQRVYAEEQAFLSAAAHQLRTPLASMRTRVELAAARADPDTARRLAGVIETSRDLARTTHQMLALARARDSLDGALKRATVDIGGLMNDVANACLDRAIDSEVDLGFDIAPARVSGARWLLREALLNLVDNALGHGRGATRVTVSSRVEQSEVWLVVEDDGCGIAPARRHALFQRFSRGDTEAPGSGLGLAIVRAAAEAHGGTVVFEPIDSPSGARFVLRLPLAAETESLPT
jgi:two-component system sensor histidine kinase TctE